MNDASNDVDNGLRTLSYIMVSVNPTNHNIIYLSYDMTDRKVYSEKYMWAIELQTRARKHFERIGFCHFLKIAQENKWHLDSNTASTNAEVIYLLHHENRS